MSFAQIVYREESEPLWVKDYVMKLPPKLRGKYFLCFVPLKITEKTLGEEKGIKITLPILPQENSQLKERFIKKAVALLMEKNIKIVINSDKIPLSYGFIETEGSLIISCFAYEIIKATYKKDLSKMKVVVVDGGNAQTWVAIKSILLGVNHISLCTDNCCEYAAFAEDIHWETGLIMDFFTDKKSTLMKEADVVINCSADMENYDYVFKKGAIYIEASPLKGKLNRLKNRRQDLKFVSHISANINGNIMEEAEIEAYLMVKTDNLLKE